MGLTIVGDAFASYRERYPCRPPVRSEIGSEDELRRLTADEGMGMLPPSPCEGVLQGIAPLAAGQSASEKYLWVVMPEGVPFALELLPGVMFERGRLAHTNLTGGADAHSGGEMWFIDQSSVVLNGGSGRYPPRSSQELEAVALGFKAAGYNVASMGWDAGANVPARILRGDPKWL